MKFNKTTKLFILAIFIRLLVMPFLFHPDLKVYNYQSSFLRQGVFNIYEQEEFVYQPLTYLFLGSYQTIVDPLTGGDLVKWLSDNSSLAIENNHLFLYLFLLKLPILFFDLLIGIIFFKYYQNSEDKKLVWYWLFNPFTIVLLYVYSNVDIFALLFLSLSFLFYKKEKNLYSALMMGVGAGFKMFPLLFLPFLMAKQRTIKKSIIYFGVTLTTFGLILFPFSGQSMIQSSVVSGLSTRIFQGKIELSFGEAIYPAVVGLFLVYIISFLNKKIPLENLCLVLIMVLFSMIHFHIQWLMWGSLFALVIWVRDKKIKHLLLVSIISAFTIPLMYNDKFMTVSLFTPISPLYSLVPTPFAIVQKVFDPNVFIGIIHSLFMVFSLILGFKLLKNE